MAKRTAQPLEKGKTTPQPQRQQPLERLADEEKAIYKPNASPAANNFDFVAHKIAVEIAFALAEKVDELNVMRGDFRSSLEMACKRTLMVIFRREERCVVIPDALPGFTLMGFKRKGGLLESATKEEQEAATKLSPESHAAAMIIGEFFEKTEEQVLVIDCPDALLALFPVSELRKNLKQLGFYFVE